MTPPIEGATGGNQELLPCPFCGATPKLYGDDAALFHDCAAGTWDGLPVEVWNRRAYVPPFTTAPKASDHFERVTLLKDEPITQSNSSAPTPAHPVAEDLEKEVAEILEGPDDFLVLLPTDSFRLADLRSNVLAVAQRQRESGLRIAAAKVDELGQPTAQNKSTAQLLDYIKTGILLEIKK